MNGSGKTRTAVTKCAKIVQENPGGRGIIIRNIERDLRDSTIPQFFFHYHGDENTIPDGHIFNRTTKLLIFPNQFKINFIALDRPDDAKKLKNLVYTFCWIEQAEEIPQSIFQMATSRAREQKDSFKNTVFLTANNEDGCWLNNVFFVDPVKLYTDFEQFRDSKIKIEWGKWQGKNKKYLGIKERPRINTQNLPDDYYENMIEDLPSDQVMRYVYNLAIGKGGLVYNFSDNNIVEEDEYFDLSQIPQLWQRFEGMDYGISETNPMAWLWGIRTIEGDIHIISEYYEYGKGIDHCTNYVNKFNCVFDEQELERSFLVGCPRAFQKEGTSNRKPSQLFNEQNLPITQFPIHFDMRQPIVEKLLETGKLKIWRKCKNLIRELQTRKWSNIKTADDHATEALERMIAKLMASQRRQAEPELDTKKARILQPLTAGIMQGDF